ncbi:hypothetical protein SETIT_8G055800v2 [Setaria italica]|uniref:Uncharacterized protein n=1 Tax=Setaria italica TaxID=4555 RepID=A0A368S4K0_SETIT|nr:hypothetical protein SETIT_8G055800v2 [Setaria italica]
MPLDLKAVAGITLRRSSSELRPPPMTDELEEHKLLHLPSPLVISIVDPCCSSDGVTEEENEFGDQYRELEYEGQDCKPEPEDPYREQELP